MEILKKTLHLNYSEQKGEKLAKKSFPFSINMEVADDKVKEVAVELAKLVDKNIDTYTLILKTTI